MAPLPRKAAGDPPRTRNIRSKYLSSSYEVYTECLHLCATSKTMLPLKPSNGETSSKYWRYNPKWKASNVRYTLLAQTACNVTRVKQEI